MCMPCWCVCPSDSRTRIAPSVMALARVRRPLFHRFCVIFATFFLLLCLLSFSCPAHALSATRRAVHLLQEDTTKVEHAYQEDERKEERKEEEKKKLVEVEADGPIVTIACGSMQGIWMQTGKGNAEGTVTASDNKMAVFRGIPYGKAGRWQPPAATCFPRGVGSPGLPPFNAQQYGPMCFQVMARDGGGNSENKEKNESKNKKKNNNNHLSSSLSSSSMDESSQRAQSEDCLNLDVYSRFLPVVNKKGVADAQSGGGGVPVMVWFYGGSLVVGSTSSYANLHHLASKGDIVLVAMNYRLNAFGWLSHPSLSSVDPRQVSGNYGTLDQQLALQWVRENIAAFGGSTTSVTVIGQSSGGTSIFALLASPASVGLFQGAISLSGSPNITIDLFASYQQNQQVILQSPCGHLQAAALSKEEGRAEAGKLTGTMVVEERGELEKPRTESNDDPLLQCLLALPPANVASLFLDSYNVEPKLPITPSGQHYIGLPIVDGVTVTSSLTEALRAGLVDVSLIIQSMAQEMDNYEGNSTIYNMTATEYNSFLTEHMTVNGWSSEAASSLTNLYANQTEVEPHGREFAYQTFMADYSFYCANIQLALLAASSFFNPVYLSIVTQPPAHTLYVSENGPPAHYAGHNWDYMSAVNAWTLFSSYQNVPPYGPAASDYALGASLLQQWLDIAKLGYVNSTAMQPVDTYGSRNTTDRKMMSEMSKRKTHQNSQGNRGFEDQEKEKEGEKEERQKGGLGHYNVAVQRSAGPQMIGDYKQDTCNTLNRPPLSLNQRFWLTN